MTTQRMPPTVRGWGRVPRDTEPATLRSTARLPLLPRLNVTLAARDPEPAPPPSGPRVLIVDDDRNVVEAIERHLGDAFDVVTATSATDALAWLELDGSFAVVVSDLYMPGMSGPALLARAAQIAPDTTRILITGQADVASAIQAVNDGQIFRFLTKPCAPAVLVRHVEDAVRQHQLQGAERELLERTLTGAIELLTDLLGLTAPAVFSRASRLRHSVKVAAARLGTTNAWECELAALLCLIGCITLPTEIVERAWAGVRLTPEERAAFEAHPAIAHKLLSAIPRLERVAEIVARQRSGTPIGDAELDAAVALLRAALERDEMFTRGVDNAEIGRELRRRQHPAVLVAALTPSDDAASPTVRGIPLAALTPGMILDADVVTPARAVLCRAGTLVSAALIERLRKIASGVGVVEPIFCHPA